MRITLCMLLLIILAVSCQHDSNLSDSKNSTGKKEGNNASSFSESRSLSAPQITRIPITLDFFQNFLNSNQVFSWVQIIYRMGIDDEHLEARRVGVQISSPIVFSNTKTEDWADRVLSEIDYYSSTYGEGDEPTRYECEFDLGSNFVSPIYQFILDQHGYYFNPTEYQGNPSLEIAMEYEFGHECFVAMNIYPHDDIPRRFPRPVRTFCKGWDPGSNPPPELMPLINYLETVIIPELRQHPYQPEP